MGTERRRAVWYFDFISPFAYLQWRALDALAPVLTFEFRPILLAALLEHHGHKGPAEIPQKRRFSYRFVTWRAQQAGIPLRFPPAHPVNPLPALRLALARVAARFGIDDAERAIADPAVKAALRANTEAAIAHGVFGVPTVELDGELPITTSGGMLAEAPLHGFNHVLEGVRQIRGTSSSQVKDAEFVLVTSSVPTPTSALVLKRR